MHIEIVIQKHDVERLIEEATPLRLHWAPADQDRRFLELERPTEVALVPMRGIRIVTQGRIRYGIAGVKLPIALKNITLFLMPEVQVEDNEPLLAFRIHIEHSELRFVPDIVDDKLVQLVNDALSPEATHLVWRFGSMLTRAFPLPDRLWPLNELHMVADGGDVHVDPDQVRMRVRLLAAVSRKSAPEARAEEWEETRIPLA